MPFPKMGRSVPNCRASSGSVFSYLTDCRTGSPSGHGDPGYVAAGKLSARDRVFPVRRQPLSAPFQGSIKTGTDVQDKFLSQIGDLKLSLGQNDQAIVFQFL